MSNPNPHKYEIVDADISIICVGNHHRDSRENESSTIVVPTEVNESNESTGSRNDDTSKNTADISSPDIAAAKFLARYPPFLPSGEEINAKSINQSYHVDFSTLSTNTTNEINSSGIARNYATNQATADFASTDVAVAKFVSRYPPVLPSGEEINAKNINQSYNVEPNTLSTNTTNEINSSGTVGNTDYDEEITSVNNPSNNESLYNVEAFAVDPHSIANAEPLPDWRRRITTLWLVIAVIVIASSVTIGVCASGKCSSNENSAPIATIEEQTTSPTGTPIEVLKAEAVTAFMNNITLSGQNITVNGSTAESDALTWMIDSDVLFNATAFISLNSFVSNEVSFRVRQRYPLITLWFQQIDVSGGFREEWNDTTGWLQVLNECEWAGIICSATDLGGNVGVQDVVTEIDFFNNTNGQSNNYQGSIPAELGLLTSLRNVDFSFNGLTGTLPASIGQWTNLTYFSVYNWAMDWIVTFLCFY
jgi:hypothetical protein